MMTLIGKQLYIALDGSMQSEGAYVDDLDVYDATTGALRWRYAIPGEEFFSLLVENGEVYLSGTQAMYALDAQNGTVRWRSMYSPNTNNSGGTLIADGQAVLAATPYGLRLYDGASGAIRWTRNLQINNPGVLVAPNGLILNPRRVL